MTSIILLRSHTDRDLTTKRLRAWHRVNPDSVIVFYDGSGGQLAIGDLPQSNVIAFPQPRRQRYGYSVLFGAYRWIADQFPGAYCHYTEYDAYPLRAGYLDSLNLPADVILAGESSPHSTGFRVWHEECRFRAIEVIGRVMDVPVSMSYAFGPSIILGGNCISYLSQFDEEDFERHIHPALERIKPDHVYDEAILMSLLVGRGFLRRFNPCAKYVMCQPCDSEMLVRAKNDPESFAVHAVKEPLSFE